MASRNCVSERWWERVSLERPIGKGQLLQKKRTDVLAGQGPFKGYWHKKARLTDEHHRS
jgi:hypothetical protein